jgi:glycosyltransferase involved in cell wall biosynthesis
MKNNNEVMSRSKILCVSSHTGPTQGFGGPAIVFRTFLTFLKEQDYNFVSISTTDKETYREIDAGSKSIFFHSPFLYKYGFSMGILIYLMCAQYKFRYVAINGLSNFPVFFSSFLAAILNKKVILFTHGGLEVSRTESWGYLKRFIYWLNILFLKFINARENLLVVYQSIDEKNKSSFKSINSIVCANYSESFFKKNSPKNFSKLSIVYIGRFSPEKGSKRLMDFLDFFSNIDRTLGHEVTIVIASEIPIKELEFYRHVEGISIFYNVLWTELTGILDRSNILYFPSHTENFGNSLVEGVAYGLVPCIYHDTHWSVLLDKKSAIVESFLREILTADFVDQRTLVEISERVQHVVVNDFIRNKDMSQIIKFIK